MIQFQKRMKFKMKFKTSIILSLSGPLISCMLIMMGLVAFLDDQMITLIQSRFESSMRQVQRNFLSEIAQIESQTLQTSLQTLSLFLAAQRTQMQKHISGQVIVNNASDPPLVSRQNFYYNLLSEDIYESQNQRPYYINTWQHPNYTEESELAQEQQDQLTFQQFSSWFSDIVTFATNNTAVTTNGSLFGDQNGISISAPMVRNFITNYSSIIPGCPYKNQRFPFDVRCQSYQQAAVNSSGMIFGNPIQSQFGSKLVNDLCIKINTNNPDFTPILCYKILINNFDTYFRQQVADSSYIKFSGVDSSSQTTIFDTGVEDIKEYQPNFSILDIQFGKNSNLSFEIASFVAKQNNQIEDMLKEEYEDGVRNEGEGQGQGQQIPDYDYFSSPRNGTLLDFVIKPVIITQKHNTLSNEQQTFNAMILIASMQTYLQTNQYSTQLLVNFIAFLLLPTCMVFVLLQQAYIIANIIQEPMDLILNVMARFQDEDFTLLMLKLHSRKDEMQFEQQEFINALLKLVQSIEDANSFNLQQVDSETLMKLCRAYRIQKNLGNKHAMGVCANNIGCLMCINGNQAQAVRYFLEAISITQQEVLTYEREKKAAGAKESGLAKSSTTSFRQKLYRWLASFLKMSQDSILKPKLNNKTALPKKFKRKQFSKKLGQKITILKDAPNNVVLDEKSTYQKGGQINSPKAEDPISVDVTAQSHFMLLDHRSPQRSHLGRNQSRSDTISTTTAYPTNRWSQKPAQTHEVPEEVSPIYEGQDKPSDNFELKNSKLDDSSNMYASEESYPEENSPDSLMNSLARQQQKSKYQWKMKGSINQVEIKYNNKNYDNKNNEDSELESAYPQNNKNYSVDFTLQTHSSSRLASQLNHKNVNNGSSYDHVNNNNCVPISRPEHKKRSLKTHNLMKDQANAVRTGRNHLTLNCRLNATIKLNDTSSIMSPSGDSVCKRTPDSQSTYQMKNQQMEISPNEPSVKRYKSRNTLRASRSKTLMFNYVESHKQSDTLSVSLTPKNSVINQQIDHSSIQSERNNKNAVLNKLIDSNANLGETTQNSQGTTIQLPHKTKNIANRDLKEHKQIYKQQRRIMKKVASELFKQSQIKLLRANERELANLSRQRDLFTVNFKKDANINDHKLIHSQHNLTIKHKLSDSKVDSVRLSSQLTFNQNAIQLNHQKDNLNSKGILNLKSILGSKDSLNLKNNLNIKNNLNLINNLNSIKNLNSKDDPDSLQEKNLRRLLEQRRNNMSRTMFQIFRQYPIKMNTSILQQYQKAEAGQANESNPKTQAVFYMDFISILVVCNMIEKVNSLLHKLESIMDRIEPEDPKNIIKAMKCDYFDLPKSAIQLYQYYVQAMILIYQKKERSAANLLTQAIESGYHQTSLLRRLCLERLKVIFQKNNLPTRDVDEMISHFEAFNLNIKFVIYTKHVPDQAELDGLFDFVNLLHQDVLKDDDAISFQLCGQSLETISAPFSKKANAKNSALNAIKEKLSSARLTQTNFNECVIEAIRVDKQRPFISLSSADHIKGNKLSVASNINSILIMVNFDMPVLSEDAGGLRECVNQLDRNYKIVHFFPNQHAETPSEDQSVHNFKLYKQSFGGDHYVSFSQNEDMLELMHCQREAEVRFFCIFKNL